MTRADVRFDAAPTYRIRYSLDSYDIHIMLTVSCRKRMFRAHQRTWLDCRLPVWIWEL